MNADTYMDHWENNRIWTHLEWPRHQQRFKTLAKYLEGKVFLDAGCAFGHSTIALKKLCPGKWTGLDFSGRAISRARGVFPEKKYDIRFKFSPDFNLLPKVQEWFGEDFIGFDSVVCSEVLEHIDEDWKLLQGIMRITKKTLVISTPCVFVDDPGHLRLYTKDSLSELLGANKKYNYEVIKDDPFFFARVWHKKTASSLKAIA